MPYIFLNTVADVTNFYVPTPIVILINNKHEQKCIKSKSTNIISDYKIGTGSLFLLNASVAEVLELLEEEGYSIVKINQNDRHNIWVLHKKLIAKQNAVMEDGDKKSDAEEEPEKLSTDAQGETAEPQESLTLDKLDIINLMQSYYDSTHDLKGVGDTPSSPPDVPKFILPQESISEGQNQMDVTSRQLINLEDLKLFSKTGDGTDEAHGADDRVTIQVVQNFDNSCKNNEIPDINISDKIKERSQDTTDEGSNKLIFSSKETLGESGCKADVDSYECRSNNQTNRDENLKKSAKCLSLKYVDNSDDALSKMKSASFFKLAGKPDYESHTSGISNTESSFVSNISTDEEADMNYSPDRSDRKNLLTFDYHSSFNRSLRHNSEKFNRSGGLGSKNSWRGDKSLDQMRSRHATGVNSQNLETSRSLRGDISSLTFLKDTDKNSKNISAFKSKIKSQPTTTSKFSRGFKKASKLERE